MSEERAITIAEPQALELSTPAIMRVAEIISRKKLVGQVMEATMISDVHYGRIPGVQIPSLYQPGAQALSLVFSLIPKFEVACKDLGNGHREYVSNCYLTNAGGGHAGHGMGSCSTMETKYRWHRDRRTEPTRHVVPKAYFKLQDQKGKQELLRKIANDERSGSVYTIEKIEGEWRVSKVLGEAGKKENPNIADTWNTVLKMANKRAFVAAILTATAASDMFTQDLEDLEEEAMKYATAPEAREKEQRPEEEPEPEKQAEKQAEKGSPKQSPPDTKANNPQPAEDKPPQITNWRDVSIHIRSSIQGRKLGTLTLSALKTVKEKWADAVSEEASAQDRKLKAAILLGISELTEGETRPAKQENLPLTGNPDPIAEAEAKDEKEKEEVIATLRGLFEEAIVTEQTVMEFVQKEFRLGFDQTSLADLPLIVLQDIFNSWQFIRDKAGWKAPEPKPSKKKKGGKVKK